ncbi:MAG: Rieske (2Fe-2S) protein [Desulfovibrionaceae bacterium]|nr:Rieske (2Fe-2S) protein [Desulfovibrionaceae bacterium]
MSLCEEQRDRSRRGFLAGGIKAVAALFGLGLGVPLLGFFLSPARRGEKHEDWIPLIELTELKDSRPTKVTYQYERKDGWTTAATRKMVFVVQNGDGAFTVISNRCSHLGCGVDWDATANQFRCPCHGGVFDLQGRVLEGPPPRPLTRLVSKVEDGSIFIREA